MSLSAGTTATVPLEPLARRQSHKMSAEEKDSPPSGSATPSILSPIEPVSPAIPSRIEFVPLVTVIGFHHARGPEVESWFGVKDGADPAADHGWTLLPFMALSDGAHA